MACRSYSRSTGAGGQSRQEFGYVPPHTLPHDRDRGCRRGRDAHIGRGVQGVCKPREFEIPQCHQRNRRYIARERVGRPSNTRYSVAGGPERSRFQPFLLDLPGSRRYIPHTFRQAVSFACSERPPDQPFESVAFSRKVIGYNASTNKAQTLPLTAPVRL